MTGAAHTRWWQIGEVVFGIPVAIAIGLQVLFPLRFPYAGFTLLAVIGGILLGLAGLALIILARRELARYRQPTDPGQPTRILVSSGVFAWSRNPIYLGAVLLLLGVALAGNFPWVVALLLPAVAACDVVLIFPEERYLAAAFGTAYRTYAATVPRWVGVAGLLQRQ